MTNSTWVLGKRQAEGHTICRIHSRDFSDCLMYHMKENHQFWERFIVKPTDSQMKPAIKKKKAVPNTAIKPVPKVIKRNLPVLRRSYTENEDFEQGMRYDPLKVLGVDVMRLVLGKLDAGSLARCGMCSKDWKYLAHSDSLWISKCTKLWEGKRHLPAAALVPGLSRITAYSVSIEDSERHIITLEDLCQHSWEFRFKNTVPEYWLELDPTRHGEPPMQRYFHVDGSQTAGSGDGVWGGHESSYSIIDEFNESGLERFVRINHWPKMIVSRTEDWGWELNNDYYVYRSLPDSEHGGTGPV